ncbi:hypothetical protein SLA2020_060490 [Shorea laevis]
MENIETQKASLTKLYPVAGGRGPLSYANNSPYQKRGLDLVKRILHQEVTNKLGTELLRSSSNQFRLADMGCAIGPNTFFVVQDIIEAVKSKYPSQEIEFQVFFNDHSANDFNTLLGTLPVEKNYFAAGVPGSFYGRLFPKASLHFVHSSYALPWLSKVPEQVLDRSSPAWNKGRVFYGSCKEVEHAYAAQFAYDFELFLKARAEEVVPGGFMALLFQCVPNEANISKCSLIAFLELLGTTLMDMTKMGLVDEAKVDSFNLPAYIASQAEVETMVERNGCFKIEKMRQLARSIPDVEKFALNCRAVFGVFVRDHFGGEIIDEVFNGFRVKVVQSGFLLNPSLHPMLDLFVFLKRKSEWSKSFGVSRPHGPNMLKAYANSIHYLG